jgi:GNAT superfamily N-acetyltransferase
MPVTLKKVLPENAHDYVLCHIACWRCAYKDIIPDAHFTKMESEIDERTEQLRKALIDQGGAYHFYYAESEGQMVGRLIFGKSRDNDKLDAGEILAIYLLEECWGKGYGQQMMDFALDELRCMGYHEVIVWVLKENHKARRFYEKANFALDGVEKEIEIGKLHTEVRYVLNIEV